MKKINLNDVRADFASGLTDISHFYATAHAAITGDRDRTFLAENTFLSAAVLWEGYISDLFLAYINRDPTQFRLHLQNALKEAIADKAKPARIFDSYGKLAIPEHLPKSDIVQLIDPRGSNITFRNYDDLKDGADRYLAENHRAAIDHLAAADQRTIDAMIAIRNHIAHRSGQSYTAMNTALGAGALHNTGLRRGANNVREIGPWLKARPQPLQPTRIELFLTRIGGIAARV
jgi:hypothetical protein